MNLRTVYEGVSAARAALSTGRYVEVAGLLDVLMAELLNVLQSQALAQYQGSRKRATRKVLRSMLKAV